MKLLVLLQVLLLCQVHSHDADPRGSCLYGKIVDEIPVTSSGSGTLTSIGYPHTYEGNADCKHVLYKTMFTMGTDVVIEVVDMKAEPGNDVLLISEGYYPAYAWESDTNKKTLTSSLQDAKLKLSETNTDYGTYKWVNEFAGNITIAFKSDTEVNAEGYKIKYAFNDCVDLDDPEHGKYTKVKVDKKPKYRLDCEEGYEVAPTDIFQFIEHEEYTASSYAHCTGGDVEEGEDPYVWKNSEYYCAHKAGDCREPIIIHGTLVQSEDDVSQWDVTCNYKSNTIRGLRSLHCVHSGGSWRWREWDTDNKDTFEYPSCVANNCDSLSDTDETTIINSAKDYVPGAYVRERCNFHYKVEDVTRWCLPTGKWTEGQHCEETGDEDHDDHEHEDEEHGDEEHEDEEHEDEEH